MRSPAPKTDRLPDQLSDLEVVTRVRGGEPALFELIMRRHNRRLFRLARAILGHDADAEDAVQEAYVKAYFRLNQFRGPQGFASWLCQIATHEALMRVRRRPRAIFTSIDTMNEPQAPQSSPEAEVQEEQLHRLLEQALDALPEVYRSAFVLREVEQMSVAETAHCLGVEEATVKTRVHRARHFLQRNLTNEFSQALSGVYGFDGKRCDRLVAQVFARIGGG